MLRIDLDTHSRLIRGELPVICVDIDTPMGIRRIAERTVPRDAEYLECSGRLKSASGFDRTIQPRTETLLGSGNSKQQQRLTVVLNNQGYVYSKIMASEPWLGRPLTVLARFASGQPIALASGRINQIAIDDANNTLTVTTSES